MRRYRVYLTPLYSAFVYGEEREISDYVTISGGQITRSIDSTDFSVGVYTFNDVELTCLNSKGHFSDASDSRSFFPYSRDRAKIRIVFDSGEDEPPKTYDGLINDDDTRINSDSDEVTLTVLGPDSVLRKASIPAGSITSGMSITQAMVAILNTSDVRSVLGVTLSNINPANDITIDDGEQFDGLNKRDALAELLGASNSVMLIDDDLNLIVRDRQPNFQNDILYLYGKGDQYGRENITSIQGYNTGLHRTFNSVRVQGGQATAVVEDVDAVQQSVAKTAPIGSARSLTSEAIYGLRQKADLNFGWVNDEATLIEIAEGYLAEFAFAKIEFSVVVPTRFVATAKILDQVSVNYPLYVTPTGRFMPVIGVTKIGDTDSPLPNTRGAIAVSSELGFKIIEIVEDIESFQSTLKLRQIGVSRTDGGLIMPFNTKTVTAAESPYQITTAYDLYLLDCSAGAIDLKLVSPLTDPQKEYSVMRIDTSRNRARVLPYAAEYINVDQTYLELHKKGDSARFGTDRSNWFGHFHSTPTIAALPQTRFTLTNSQAAAANVTALSFDKTLYRTAIVEVDVRRKTDTAASEVRARHRLTAIYNTQADTWTLHDHTTGDEDGVTFTITSAGQVQYTSTDITGSNGVHNADFGAGVFHV